MQAGQGNGKRATGRPRHAAAVAPPCAAGLPALQGLPEEALGRLVDALVPRLVAELPPVVVDLLLARLVDAVAERLSARLQPAPPVDLAKLLQLVHDRLGDAVWTVRELHENAFVKAADTHRLGRDLGKLHRQGGHFNGLRLHRISGKQDRQREGVVWKLTRAGCDDDLSSPQGAAATMRALQTWSRS